MSNILYEHRDDHCRLHREDGPAKEYANGNKYWYCHGELHREDGPAVDRPNGDKGWWYRGKYHREDGPAAIDWVDNTEEYWLHGVKVEKFDIVMTKSAVKR